MYAWLLATVFLAALIVPATDSYAAPAEDQHRPTPNESFEQLFPSGLFDELYSHALSTLQDYIELEGNLPGEGSSRQQAGEFRLKLFPQGKSRSQEHLSAEGSFRLSPETDQQEFTLRFKASKNPPHPLLSPNDDVI